MSAGVAALLAAASWLAIATGCDRTHPVPARADTATHPNVVLVTLDTTRADRLSPYGYERPITPHLERLAADSIVYLDAVSTSSWTLPSHASILTGKYPMSHGARFDPDGPLRFSEGIEGPDEWRVYRARGLSKDEVTLPQRLRDAGYTSGAIVAGPWMNRIFGLGTGFDHYDDSLVTDVRGGLAADVTDRALAWVRENGASRFFLFLNYYDPHGPYLPPLSFRLSAGPHLWFGGDESDEKVISRFYDAEIEYLDQQLGRLLDTLRELELYDDALIVVTADHGELLGEHGKRGHGLDVTQQELHVPLLVKLPANQRAGERRAGRVSNAGIFSLILERVGIDVPDTAQAHIPAGPEARIVAETHPLLSFSDRGSSRALFADRFKLVWNSKRGTKLYDLEADPAEYTDFSSSYPEVAEKMTEDLDQLLANAPEPGDAGPVRQIDPETERALGALGYLE